VIHREPGGGHHQGWRATTPGSHVRRLLGLWSGRPYPGFVFAVTVAATRGDATQPKEMLMFWTYVNAPTVKVADLHQSAFALSLGGSATASNVAVQTIG
jgi:hypothetical protein